MNCPICLEFSFDNIFYPCNHNICLNCFEKNPKRFECCLCRNVCDDIDLMIIKFKDQIIDLGEKRKNLLIITHDYQQIIDLGEKIC